MGIQHLTHLGVSPVSVDHRICSLDMATAASYSISLSRLLSRLESSLGDQEKLNGLNEVELRKAAAVCILVKAAAKVDLEHWQCPEASYRTREVAGSRKTRPVRLTNSKRTKLCSITIAQQRKRILNLHNQVTQAQQNLSNLSEPEDEEEPIKPESAESHDNNDTTNNNNKNINEPISSLRNRLFADRQGKQGDTDTSSTEHVLQHHRMLQDDISGAMLGMARGLKERSLAFGEALREDSKVLV